MPAAPIESGGQAADARGVEKAAPQDDFAAWLGAPVIGRVTLSQQHGQWYARAEAFRIAGVGSTEAAAYRNVAQLVEKYLRSYFEEGRTFDDALRARQPPRAGLIDAAVRAIGRALERVDAPWSNGHKSDLVLPSTLQHVGPPV